METARFLVSGRVQGVGFRAAARAEALRLGVNGHARNLRDGTVEVVARGSAEALDVLEAWLQHGPDGARVDATRRERWAGEVPRGFLTR